MEFGVHLPLLAFRGHSFSLSRRVDYAETAERLGFTTLCANDHLTFSRPWLDSLTALASILTKTRHMTLMWSSDSGCRSWFLAPGLCPGGNCLRGTLEAL
jgi:Luciferase-like monooxygenase